MEFEQLFKNLGFSENEVKVYLAALETGSSSAQEIARKAKIIRTTTYSVLEGLIVKGFIFKTKDKGKGRYIADSPENLLKKFENYGRQFRTRLPQLQAIYNSHKIKPKIIFFEGKNGIEEIYIDTIREKPQEILEYNTSHLFKALPDYFPTNYIKERKKHNIHARRIAPDDKYWRERAKNDDKELSKTILLPPEEFDPPVEINIYKNKVAIMSYSDELGLIIESEGVSKTMRQVYELLWGKLT